MTILASCGQNKPFVSVNNVGYKNKVVLGAYVDMLDSYSTFNELELKELPRVVDLSPDMTPAKDQGDRGTCTFFSAIGLIEGAIKKDLKLDVNLSEEYFNYATKTAGYYQKEEGSNVTNNFSAMDRYGLILEEDWSYQGSWFGKGRPCKDYTSTDSNAPVECYSHNKPNQKAIKRLIDAKPIRYNAIYKNTNEIIRFLGKERRPLSMDVTVNFNGWPNSGETTYNEELRQECLSTPEQCGGHSVILTGYDMDKKVFMFKNSWGAKWGKNGYGTIPFDVVDQYVTGAFYYVNVSKDLKLPVGKTPEVKLNKFDVSVDRNEDKSISLHIDSDVEETSGKMFYISSYLVKKSKNYVTELPSDGNSELVRIAADDQAVAGDEYPRVATTAVPGEKTRLTTTPDQDLGLLIPTEMLSVPSIDSLFGNQDYEKLLRTTIYVHTDDSTFKVLKRIYSPLK